MLRLEAGLTIRIDYGKPRRLRMVSKDEDPD